MLWTCTGATKHWRFPSAFYSILTGPESWQQWLRLGFLLITCCACCWGFPSLYGLLCFWCSSSCQPFLACLSASENSIWRPCSRCLGWVSSSVRNLYIEILEMLYQRSCSIVVKVWTYAAKIIWLIEMCYKCIIPYICYLPNIYIYFYLLLFLDKSNTIKVMN